MTWNRANYERINLLDIRNLYDLLVNFHEANSRVIAVKRNGSRLFVEFTDILGQVLEIFDQIPVEIDDINKVTLITIPELSAYNFSYQPLSFGTFLKLCNLLVHKQNALQC